MRMIYGKNITFGEITNFVTEKTNERYEMYKFTRYFLSTDNIPLTNVCCRGIIHVLFLTKQ